MATDKTPFQRAVDDLTDGCGCACHTGIGYRSSCEHCRPHIETITGRYRSVVCYGRNQNLEHPIVPIYAFIENEGQDSPIIPGALVDKIVRKEYSNWISPLAQIIEETPTAEQGT